MCPPDHYDVLDVKNPFMAGHVGSVNKGLARKQWDDLKAAFESAGKPVTHIDPVPGLEDMVFCANQTFVGVDPKMEKICLLGQMRHSSRRREVPAFEAWFKSQGYRIVKLKDSAVLFEGAGDAIWHPGKRLIWGGHGFRSQPEVYEEVARAFDSPVVLLKLVNERFYHLDTCFCPLTPEAVLIYPSAFDAESLELILKIFPIVLTAGEGEAVRSMACNAAVVDGKTAILQKGAASVSRHMAVMGLKVIEVDTSEYIKSGGSVYCMKMFCY
jgi:N-dimethylarginine dimethylaminohydrolase